MFDPSFLTPRDIVADNGTLRLNGPLIADSTRFAMQCLKQPQTADAIRAVAGIDVPTYNYVGYAGLVTEEDSRCRVANGYRRTVCGYLD